MLIALIVTLACLPLLVIDMVSASSSSSAAESAAVTEQVPDPSLVVAASPSIVSTSITEASPTTEILTDVSPATTAAPLVVAAPAATTTTTTAPLPVVTAPPMNESDAEFLACVRWRESHGDYTASDPSGTYLGAYQIYQGGWDSVAASVGRFDLVGVPPNHASAPDQDEIAVAMLRMSGRSPWGGYCG